MIFCHFIQIEKLHIDSPNSSVRMLHITTHTLTLISVPDRGPVPRGKEIRAPKAHGLALGSCTLTTSVIKPFTLRKFLKENTFIITSSLGSLYVQILALSPEIELFKNFFS